MDIRLRKADFVIGDRAYKLQCNMNVLADVQEMYNGDLVAALEKPSSVESLIAFLTAMVNDYLDEIGETVRYTRKDIGRLLPPGRLRELRGTVMGLVVDALSTDEIQEDSEKNVETTRGQSTSRGIFPFGWLRSIKAKKAFGEQ